MECLIALLLVLGVLVAIAWVFLKVVSWGMYAKPAATSRGAVSEQGWYCERGGHWM